MLLVENNDNYDYLWQVWQKEKQSNELQLLPNDFYDKILKQFNMINTDDIIHKTTKENILKLLYNIYERRKQKLIVYVAYNRQISQNMPKIEIDFHKKLLNFTLSEKLDIDKNIKDKKLLVIQEIPKIILPSGNEIGPVKKDEYIDINNDNDKVFLITNNICKDI